MQKINKLFQIPKWLFVVLILIVIFRIPNFFEPYSYGDETIYLTLGEGMRNGLTLFRDIHDNKPPLLYAAAALAGSLFWFKAILLFWMLITTVLFWKLAETLFPKNTRLHQIATIVFAFFTTIPLFEGNIVNAELFMIGATIGAFLLLFKKEHTSRNIFLAGLLFSVGTLFKVPAAFDIPAIVLLWFITMKFTQKNFATLFKKTLILAFGFALPIALTFVWYWGKGAFNDYLIAAWLQNFGYLSSFRPDDVQEPFLVKNGPLLIRAGIVGFGFLILFSLRKKLSKEFIFLCAWLLLSLFAITLSERPYPHYLVQAVPPVALLLGMLFTLQTLEQSLVIIPLSLFLFVPVYFHFWYYKTIPYYTRFYKYAITKTLTVEEYRSTFGGETNRNYKLAEFLMTSSKPSDPVFVWGSNSSTVYALAKRLPPIKYVADYHISDFSSQEEVIGQLEQNPPSFVVFLPDSPSFPLLDSLLRDRYGIAETIDGATIWKRIFDERLPN